MAAQPWDLTAPNVEYGGLRSDRPPARGRHRRVVRPSVPLSPTDHAPAWRFRPIAVARDTAADLPVWTAGRAPRRDLVSLPAMALTARNAHTVAGDASPRRPGHPQRRFPTRHTAISRDEAVRGANLPSACAKRSGPGRPRLPRAVPGSQYRRSRGRRSLASGCGGGHRRQPPRTPRSGKRASGPAPSPAASRAPAASSASPPTPGRAPPSRRLHDLPGGKITTSGTARLSGKAPLLDEQFAVTGSTGRYANAQVQMRMVQRPGAMATVTFTIHL